MVFLPSSTSCCDRCTPDTTSQLRNSCKFIPNYLFHAVVTIRHHFAMNLHFVFHKHHKIVPLQRLWCTVSKRKQRKAGKTASTQTFVLHSIFPVQSTQVLNCRCPAHVTLRFISDVSTSQTALRCIPFSC